MSFAGKVWRLLVGIKDALVLVLLLAFFSAIFAALSFRPSPAAVREGALLLDLDGQVVEEPEVFSPLGVLLGGRVPTQQFAARDLVRAIDQGAKDTRIKAIALDLSRFLGGGQVHMQEIGAALDRFRATKKPVYAFAVAYTDDSTLLAAHASEVWLDPLGGAVVRGPGGETLYYKSLFDRFGIKAHVFRVGTYKSAVEPYMLDGMSPDARENLQAIYTALWDGWRANVAKARPQVQIDRVSIGLPALLTENGGDLSKAALAAGVADRVGTRAEWGERIARQVGADPLDKTPGSFANTPYDAWLPAIAPRGGGIGGMAAGNRAIGVVTIAGDIVDGDAGPGTAGGDRIAGLLDDALDQNLAALVVRIDSPGGTVTGAETIRRAILRQKARHIPVVVSMANLAASGGYWVATTGDRIFAEPETITGSIGIFAVIPSFEDLLGRYGVHGDGVRTTPLSGQPDIFSGLTPETEQVLQASVDGEYGRFVGLVAEARGITPARANELGQGRVWSGGAARQLGLVDQFGDLDDALEFAAKQAQLKPGSWHPVYLGQGEETFSAMAARMLGIGSAGARASSGDLIAQFARGEQDTSARIVGELGRMFAMEGAQARCVECVGVVPPSGPPASPPPQFSLFAALARSFGVTAQ